MSIKDIIKSIEEFGDGWEGWSPQTKRAVVLLIIVIIIVIVSFGSIYYLKKTTDNVNNGSTGDIVNNNGAIAVGPGSTAVVNRFDVKSGAKVISFKPYGEQNVREGQVYKQQFRIVWSGDQKPTFLLKYPKDQNAIIPSSVAIDSKPDILFGVGYANMLTFNSERKINTNQVELEVESLF